MYSGWKMDEGGSARAKKGSTIMTGHKLFPK